MVTPAIITVLLVLPYVVVTITGGSKQRRVTAGSFGLSLVFLFTGIGHFVQTAPMEEMIPPLVPGRTALVYATGILEIAAAAGLFAPTLRKRVGHLLVLLLIAFLPFNVYAAWNQVPMGGHAWGLSYLAVRIPLQLILIAWTYRFACKGGEQ